ncbi:serine/arginine-rich splicing factor 7-like isoform X2 [Asterias rubens]|uniref:serine/arginine-rich splicing factor 7-like isoform X2 n=1 Tax=Asterias rubens TaxID=7604 RepID=UPI001455A1DB|nr:serine/arginine-rich splicing factor 7-like isoform X2 [Asterias rubens]
MSAQLFIGRLSKQTRQRDVEDVFMKYGPMQRCELKYGTGMAYAFIDYEDPRDAEDAQKFEDRQEICGQSIVVEWARGPKRGVSDDECYKCGGIGHFARACRSDTRGYRGGFGGYGRSRRRSNYRSRSRSPVRRRSRSPPRRRSRSPPRRRSRSPVSRRSRSRDRNIKGKRRSHSRSNSPKRSRSPRRSRSPHNSKSPRHSRTPRRSRSATPRRSRTKSRSNSPARSRSGERNGNKQQRSRGSDDSD